MLRNCNFDYQSPEHLFDPSEPGGTYICNLADPYERVVGNELVCPTLVELMSENTLCAAVLNSCDNMRMNRWSLHGEKLEKTGRTRH